MSLNLCLTRNHSAHKTTQKQSRGNRSREGCKALVFSKVTWKEGEKQGRGMLKENRCTGNTSNSILVLQKHSFL